MGKQDSRSRRDFLQDSMLGFGGLGLAAMMTQSVVTKPVEAEPAPQGVGEGIRVGVIGVGGRGQGILRTCQSQGAEIAAVCDVYEGRINQAKSAAPDAEVYHDYRKLLERKDIDAVAIATPDHWHCQILVDACDAGKDAYCEKPLSKTINEGKRMVEAVRRNNRVVQVGNQYRSSPTWAQAAEYVRSGKLGRIHWVRVWDTRDWSRGDPFSPPKSAQEGRLDGHLDWDTFLGKAPKVPFDPWRYFAWRWYWDYAGGMLTDIGAHEIGLVHWIMDIKGPMSVAANGGNYFFEHWETPDVVEAVWDYGDFTAAFTVQFLNGFESSGGAFFGTDAALVVGRGGSLVIPQGKGPEDAVERWGRDESATHHIVNWLECVKSREDPNSPIEYGHQVIAACHLANRSYREGRRLYWDVTRERVFSRPPRRT
jgi:predicted dehydrogenase